MVVVLHHGVHTYINYLDSVKKRSSVSVGL